MKTHWMYAVAGALVASAVPYVVQYGLAQTAPAQSNAATISQPATSASIEMFSEPCVARRARLLLANFNLSGNTIAHQANFTRERTTNDGSGTRYHPELQSTNVICDVFSQSDPQDRNRCVLRAGVDLYLRAAEGALALARIQTAGGEPVSGKQDLHHSESCVRTLHSAEDVALHVRAIRQGVDDFVLSYVAAQRPQQPAVPITPDELAGLRVPR